MYAFMRIRAPTHPPTRIHAYTHTHTHTHTHRAGNDVMTIRRLEAVLRGDGCGGAHVTEAEGAGEEGDGEEASGGQPRVVAGKILQDTASWLPVCVSVCVCVRVIMKQGVGPHTRHTHTRMHTTHTPHTPHTPKLPHTGRRAVP